MSALLVVLFGGCQEPTQLIPATPPGVAYQPPLPKSETDNAPEALGETGRRKGADPLADIEPALPTAKGELKRTKSGVKYETLEPGAGPAAKAGEKVTVHYTGTLPDGQVFDSSRERGKPATFTLSPQGMIKGWVDGVTGMKAGERRRLIIPPALGYGDEPHGSIPANSTLTFDIELIKTEP